MKDKTHLAEMVRIGIICLVISSALGLFAAAMMTNRQSDNKFVRLMNTDARTILRDMRCTLTFGLFFCGK